MAKSTNKKVTKKIKNRIIELHLQDMGTNEISAQLYREDVDLSSGTIDRIISEYYISIGEKRIKRTVIKPKRTYTAEEIEEQLLQQLAKGRPAEEVYRVARKINCLTDKILSEIESKGYNIPDKKQEGNERWIK